MLPTAPEEALKTPMDTVEEEAGTWALDSIIGKRLTTYPLVNEFIDPSDQKEGSQDIPTAWSIQ